MSFEVIYMDTPTNTEPSLVAISLNCFYMSSASFFTILAFSCLMVSHDTVSDLEQMKAAVQLTLLYQR